MNPRTFLNFLRSTTGLLILFLLGLAVVLVLVISYRHRISGTPIYSGKADLNTAQRMKPQVLESFARQMVPYRPPQDDQKKGRTAPLAAAKKAETPIAIPPISLVAETPSNEPKAKELSSDFAPFGRLIPCELIVTVDSSSINTPIIGLITEDVYHHGRLVISAGTEVHGTAQLDRTRERIASEGRWTLVWQTGEELSVTGLALDRECEEGRGTSAPDTWGITDGSAGLRGRLIKTDDLAEIKLFAATLLSGAADALTEKRSSPFGSFALPNLQNAPLKGAQNVLDRYAQQILAAIERDGVFVRVPAGKQFYLYITQTIDRAEAKAGGVLLTTATAAQPTPPNAAGRITSVQPPAVAFRASPQLRALNTTRTQLTP
jgi:hypothetical protein